MEPQDILVSPVEQGMDCPRQDGTLDLYMIKRSNRMILSCSECEATCDAPATRSLEGAEPYAASDLFPSILGIHTQLTGYAQELGISELELHDEMVRVLNHHLFSVPEQEFSKLIVEAWNLRRPTPSIGMGFTHSITQMGRPIGINGETEIYMEYRNSPEQINDARPVFNKGES